MNRFIKRSGLVTRNIGGETIMVPVEGHVGDLDCIYTLNDVGSAIWQLIDGENTIDKIAAEIYDQYEVTIEEAHQDVADLIDSLRKAGLLIRNDGEAAGK